EFRRVLFRSTGAAKNNAAAKNPLCRSKAQGIFFRGTPGRRSGKEHQPLTAPAEMPSTNWSCAQKKTISCGRMEIRDKARIRFHAKPVSPSIDSLTKRDMGYLAGVET